jgi:hypothetical protein
MENEKLRNTLDNFNGNKVIKNVSSDGKQTEVCDNQTGECFILSSKDGIVERINKKFITEDGRQLLQD